MSEDMKKGERFSLLYLRQDELLDDSKRFRFRVMKEMEQSIDHKKIYNFGSYLESKLGIHVLRSGINAYYILWGDILEWELRDVLCSITLTYRFLGFKEYSEKIQMNFLFQIRSIFEEERMKYQIDEKGGVHPFVDPSFQANFSAAVRRLSGAEFRATKEYIEKADQNLLPSGDLREAIRATFDAAENTFKYMFSRATRLNSQNIESHFKPFVQKKYKGTIEQKASLKNLEAFRDWVDACHNYRHAEGQPDPAAPPEELAVAMVSQGISHLRWLVDLNYRS